MFSNQSEIINEKTPLNQNANTGGGHISSQTSVASSNGENPRAAVEETNLNRAADRLSMRLVACGDNDAMENLVLKTSFSLEGEDQQQQLRDLQKEEGVIHHRRSSLSKRQQRKQNVYDKSLVQRVIAMFSLAILGLIIILVLLRIASLIVGPPSQPIGSYRLVEIQVCLLFPPINHAI